MKCAPIFSYMKYKKFDIHVWKYAPYLHTWNIENSVTIDGNLPPYFHIWNTKKSIFHIWNMHLYYHTWNIENSIFIYEICTWLRPLFHPWDLGSRGFNGWTLMGLKWPDRVPLIKWPVTSTVWFDLAGTTPGGWYPDPLALRTSEKSPGLQASWCRGPQLKPWECSLLAERAVSQTP